MHPVTREEYPLDNLHRIVSGVTFFKELLKTDAEQFELLMSQTQFITAENGEIILHKGDDANVLFFLLRGELDVINEDDDATAIGAINPGEPFGVMAMVLNFKRSASIRVTSKQALLAGIEFEHFKQNNTSLFSLHTRITFFRMLNSNIRWTLERYKIEHPSHHLVQRIRSLPIFTGEKNTTAELHALTELAHIQAELLRDWNDA